MFLIENVDTQYFHTRGYENITSLVGYAGGKYTSADSGYVCYHNGNVFTDYNKLGHAEAVSVELSYSKGADTIDKQTLGQFKLLVSHFLSLDMLHWMMEVENDNVWIHKIEVQSIVLLLVFRVE